jgi:hypothetical protein
MASRSLRNVLRLFADEANAAPFLLSTAMDGCLDWSREPTPCVGKSSKRMRAVLAICCRDASTLVAYPDTPCGAVADMMVEMGTGRVPIVDAQSRRVIGIISRQDLLKVRSTKMRGEEVRPVQFT